MTNAEVVSKWIEAMDKFGYYSPKALHSNSMHADGIYLVSYATPIAKYDNGKFQLINRKFSHITSKHQNLVKYYVPSEKLELVDDISCPKDAFPWKWSGK